MKKVSVIIPVYNVEKYIKECINSLINQTFKDYEIILIDDGSTDESGNICDKYSNDYKFITTIHKKNEGVSIARNKGIEMSTGEYIVFIDADDYLTEDYLKIMVNNIEKFGCDVCTCNYLKLYDKYIETTNYKNKKKINKKKYIKIISDEKKIGGFLWNKIYRSQIIKDNNLFFDKDICIMEDLLFNIKISSYINYAIHIDEKLYYYRQRHNSAIGNKKNYNNFIPLEKIIEELQKKNSYISNIYKLRYIFENEKCKILNIAPDINKEKHKRNLKKYISINTFLLSDKYSIKLKIILLYFFPKIYKSKKNKKSLN